MSNVKLYQIDHDSINLSLRKVKPNMPDFDVTQACLYANARYNALGREHSIQVPVTVLFAEVSNGTNSMVVNCVRNNKYRIDDKDYSKITPDIINSLLDKAISIQVDKMICDKVLDIDISHVNEIGLPYHVNIEDNTDYNSFYRECE